MGFITLAKRDLGEYDVDIWFDMSGSMADRDCPNRISRFDHALEWVKLLVQEVELHDDDGPTVGFFNDRLKVFSNTTYADVKPTFESIRPGGSTDTAAALRHSIDDYLNERLGIPTRGMFGKMKAGKPNPSVKKRIVLVITDGAPKSESEVERAIVAATKRMADGGLTPDDLVISFIQVGYDSRATRFLKHLNDGLEGRAGATMDIVGAITCDDAMKMKTASLLAKALDAD